MFYFSNYYFNVEVRVRNMLRALRERSLNCKHSFACLFLFSVLNVSYLYLLQVVITVHVMFVIHLLLVLAPRRRPAAYHSLIDVSICIDVDITMYQHVRYASWVALLV